MISINTHDGMVARSFDLDQLRALVAVIDAEGFTAAARATGGLQSTMSMKIRRLEELAGQPLLLRLGRRVAPTASGRRLADQAREILRLNDQAWGDLASAKLTGRVRIGVPDDYAARFSETIRTFRLAHPEVDLDMVCAFSVDLAQMVQEGTLDLAVVTRHEKVPGGEVLDREPLVWVAAPGFRPDPDGPLPLSVYPRDICAFRGAMTSALTSDGVRWRIAYTSQSLTGQTAIVGAGLAVTAMTRSMVPAGLHELTAGLPDLPGIDIALHRRPGRPTEPARLLGEMIRESYPHG